MSSTLGVANDTSFNITSYTTPIFHPSDSSSSPDGFDGSSVIVAIKENFIGSLSPIDFSSCVDELEADTAMNDIYSDPIIRESEFAHGRIAKILKSMTEEERHLLLVPIEEKSLQPDSILFLKDKINDQDVPVSALDFLNAMLENWPNECNLHLFLGEDFSFFDEKAAKHLPNISVPKTPGVFCSLRKTRVQLMLAFCSFALAAVVCAAVYFALSASGKKSEKVPKTPASDFTFIAQFKNSLDTTDFDSTSLRYDNRLQQAICSLISDDAVYLQTWDGREVQGERINVRLNNNDSLTPRGQMRCLLISVKKNNKKKNKPVLFCVSPRSATNESSLVINLFDIKDRISEIHFPGSDSINKIQLIEYSYQDEPVVWYTMQMMKSFGNTFEDDGALIGRISASESQFLRISSDFTNVLDTEFDKLWYVLAVRLQSSDNSLNVLHVQRVTQIVRICNFAFIEGALKSVTTNCTYFVNLFHFIKDVVSTSVYGPVKSLEPPRAFFVRGKFLKGQEWIEIWVIYSIVTDDFRRNNSSQQSLGHLLLRIYDVHGEYLTDISHNTTKDVELPSQNPIGLVVADADCLFVSFSARDGSSRLARYTFSVCFNDPSLNCAPLIFEI